MKIIKLSEEEEIHEIIERRKPLGLFYCQAGYMYIAVDNSTGDAWTEAFSTEEGAIRWLKRE